VLRGGLDQELHLSGRCIKVHGHVSQPEKVLMTSSEQEVAVVHLRDKTGADGLQVTEYGANILLGFLNRWRL
jgi:hypothetical protein